MGASVLDFVFFSRLLFRIKTHSKVLNKILLNLIIVSFVGSMAQAADFEQVDQLIKNRQYETAFRVLHEKDKRYTNPTYVSKMAYLAINYNAQCMMGRVFSFENLEGDETLESIRSKQGTHKVYPFELEKHLNNLIRRHPKNLELKLALADYYYSGICGISENKINRAEALYDSVYGKADFTANSLQNYGILKLKAKNDSLAIKAFQEALALNDNLATSHYNLAITLKDPEVLDKALAHGLKAVELYTDKKSKSEAALVVAGIYAELNDAENAITYAKIADAEKYMNYPLVYKSILDVYLKLNDMKLADDVADRLLAMQPENVSMAESVLTSYEQWEKRRIL